MTRTHVFTTIATELNDVSRILAAIQARQQQMRPAQTDQFVAPRYPLEAAIANLWAEVLHLDQIGVYDNFFTLGGHSLLAVQLLSRLTNQLQITLPLRHVIEAPTVAGMSRLIAAILDGATPEELSPALPDLYAEVILDEAIRPTQPVSEQTTTSKAIFLTGATGFVGAYLLAELLQHTTTADIYCLLRGQDEEEARQRLQQTCHKYQLSSASDPRIIPVVGDLAQPLFGLASDRFDALAQQIDQIFHCGALVNFIYPYSALRAPNVQGTHEVLRLACRGKVKPVHYLSTLAVFHATGYGDRAEFAEHDWPEYPETLADNYDRSKWVAEQIVRLAQQRGLPVTIHRPGQVMGHRQTGIVSTSDMFCAMLQTCIQMGCAPQEDYLVDLTPVDFLSQAIAYLSLRKENWGRVFHYPNPQPMPWRDLVSWLNAAGYPVRFEPYEQWLKRFMELAGQEPSRYALAAFLPMWIEQPINPQALGQQRYGGAATQAALRDAPFACPPVDEHLLTAYFDYFTRSGFLPTPCQ